MERQGTCIHNHVNSRQYVGASMHVLVFLAVLFFFAVNAWSQCVTIDCATGGSVDYAYSLACPNGVFGRMGVVQGCGAKYGGSYYCATSLKEVHSTYGTFVACPTQCQATEAYCRDQGLDFDADSCKCKLPCPESVCDAYKTQCEDVLMGSFTGRCERSGAGGEPCCNGYCDICKGPAIQGNYNVMKKICCGQSKAPPAISNVCWQTPAFSSGCHVYQSTVRAPEGEQWACHDPNQSQDMMDRYINECFGGSSSSTGGSSGSGGNSSDEGGGGSSGGTPSYPEGCDECPWLDSILDTLTAQKSTIDQIYACVKYPSLCDPNASSETNVEIDSNILNGVKDLIDSSLELSNEQIEALLKLDTNTLKMLKLDSASLSNDTLTRLAILSVGGDIQNSLSDVQLSVVHMNDTTRKWLRRLADSLSAQNDSNRKYFEMVADSIGVTADSLKAHLDSIRDAIPKDILDSILKYQKERANDSIVISSLPGLDSMIDTTVHYWKKIMHNDSLFHKDNKDSLKVIHDAIDGIGLNVGFVLGYGDTATTDLHEDLLNLRDSIVSTLKNLPGADTSRYGENNDSIRAIHEAIDTMRSDVNVFRDSVIKYYRASYSADSVYRVAFGDSVGSLHGAIDGVKGSVDGVRDAVEGLLTVTGGSLDSNGIRGMWRDSVLRYDVSANYDSVESAWGADKIDARFDSSYAYGMCSGNDCPPCSDDSCMGTINPQKMLRAGDSIIAATGVGDALQQSVQHQRDSLPTLFDSVYQELRDLAFFRSFDSTFLANIGAKIPNTNTCPEQCFEMDVNGTYAYVKYALKMDWNLCAPIAPQQLNRLNAFDIIKLLARLLTVISCISIIMWEVSSSRGRMGF